MKKTGRMVVAMALACALALSVSAQKIDDARMERDIEVAENVLGTLMKQKFEKRSYFPFEVEGKYMAGYGVTFRVPSDFNTSWIVLTEDVRGPGNAVVVGEANSYSYTIRSESREARAPLPRKGTQNRDSLATIYHAKVIEAAKEFLADYGDLISQLSPDERIMITNRGGDYYRYNFMNANSPKRTMLSVEATKADMAAVRSGKLTRDQFLGKVKVVNTTTINEMDPDLELLSSIFNRLYREDLSKTFYINEGMYYERMKDFGAIYYMNVYSSLEDGDQTWRMPTQDLNNLSQADRDKKVTSLYPQFEKELKENMVEYGRTVRSLKDGEMLVFTIKLTKCTGCGIPSTLELSLKSDVLKQFNTGALTKDAAVATVNVKKGPAQ